MNESIISPASTPSSGQGGYKKDITTSQVLLPKTLTQRLKDDLKQLKKDTGADYSPAHFIARVLEKHGMTEMEQLRKGLEKLNWNKG